MPEAEKAVKDPRATAIIVQGDIKFKDFIKYEKLAKGNNLKFTVRHDPDFVGDVGLIVISDQAVN